MTSATGGLDPTLFRVLFGAVRVIGTVPGFRNAALPLWEPYVLSLKS
jgi:hypothetical protein